jgi:Fe-S cluster biosynthesis and repair protein YggX
MLITQEAWRSWIKMMIAANKEVDSRNKDDRKIMRIKTRSAIIVV